MRVQCNAMQCNARPRPPLTSLRFPSAPLWRLLLPGSSSPLFGRLTALQLLLLPVVRRAGRCWLLRATCCSLLYLLLCVGGLHPSDKSFPLLLLLLWGNALLFVSAATTCVSKRQGCH